MRTPPNLVRLAAPVAAVLLLSACGGDGDGDELASVGLDADDTTEEMDGTGEADDPDDADEAGSEPASEAAGTDDTSDDGDDSTTSVQEDVVDLTEAIPGTWPVGDAGTVTFSLADGDLVLDDVTTNDGWSSDIDGQDPDEIGVDYTRGDVSWEIDIELEDDSRILEIEIDQDIEPADTGSYDIGDAGTFAFSVIDGQLVLDDLNVTDGWTLGELDEATDEIEFELVNGPRSFDVEVELEDDGTIELEIDYEVTGPVTG